MTYESLLLNYGGGVIPSSCLAAPSNKAATLVIGIGGTGVTALAQLKRKVYQHIRPDHPDDPHPRYDHIQFLAIDSDETAIDSMRGKARLNKATEFFSIGNPHLKAALSGKDIIKSTPTLNWMEIDRINGLGSFQGAGGVRQVGRYLLMGKAAALKVRIEEKCITALRGLASPSLNIYIFAGISGGTGSGCFLDTCYIVRKVLEDRGWTLDGNITGFFFLPDVVVTSRPELACNPACVAFNQANGYAALKELDYLMDLKSALDSFQQNYGAFWVDTQEPPVDFCHLISSTRADGTAMEKGFTEAIEQSTDYALACLEHTELSSRLKVLFSKSIAMLPHKNGANRSYITFETTRAAIPTIQVATYLAAGFYRRFQSCIGRSKSVITKPIVDDWVQRLGLTINQVYNDLVKGCDSLFLPEIDRKELAMYGVMPKGKVPQPWADPGSNWIDRCSGKRMQNCATLSAPLNTFDFDKAPTDSLTGRVFRKLFELSMDPEYGPYYAAGLLNHSGYDLMSALNGAIKQTEEQLELIKSHLYSNGGAFDLVQECSANFIRSNFLFRNQHYRRYQDSVSAVYLMLNRLGELEDTISTLRSLQKNLDWLYHSYFAPLIKLLDDLEETFDTDINYLNSPSAVSTACDRHILELSDIKPRLDGVIDSLTKNELVEKFMAHILKGYDQWESGDDSKIGQYISRFMEEIFDAQVNLSLEDYLFDLYPASDGNPALLTEEVERNIIEPLCQSALCPRHPTVAHTDTYQFGSISLPHDAPAVCAAADHFKHCHSEYMVWQTGFHDRIFLLYLFFGVPLYAHQHLSVWKHAYDAVEKQIAGAGIHLYADTGRGTDGGKNWRSFLPDPTPASLSPQLSPCQEKLCNVYRQAEEAGIIQKGRYDYFVLYKTPALSLPNHQPEDFLEDCVFQRTLLDAARSQLVNQLNDFCNHTLAVEEVPLRNDGDPQLGDMGTAQVRLDYFLRFPVLQQIAREELDKLHSLQDAIQRLDRIQADLTRSG